MIVVCNVSEEYSRTGIQQYEVRINDIKLSSFEHNSEEGMSVCLHKAAESLKNVDIDAKIKEHRIGIMLELMAMDLSNV